MSDEAGCTKQLTLDLPLRPALGREDFFITTANADAVAMIDKWPDWPGAVLIMLGPKGSGKTHLAEVWRAMSGAITVPISKLSRDAVPELLAQGHLVIEDLSGQLLDEVALFHLINLAREQGRHILLTGDVAPGQWGVKLPDLLSRLRAAPTITLNSPDDDLLRAAIIKQFSDRQILLDEAAVSYILSRAERSFAAIRDLVVKIDHESLARHARITRPFIAKIMAGEQPDMSEGED